LVAADGGEGDSPGYTSGRGKALNTNSAEDLIERVSDIVVDGRIPDVEARAVEKDAACGVVADRGMIEAENVSASGPDAGRPTGDRESPNVEIATGDSYRSGLGAGGGGAGEGTHRCAASLTNDGHLRRSRQGPGERAVDGTPDDDQTNSGQDRGAW